MIHVFKSAKRILFFPKKWANSVSNWILGVHSSDGSLIIKNTANPGSDRSIDLRVNDTVLSQKINEIADRHGLNKNQRECVKDIVHGLIDGVSLEWHDKSFAVNTDWVTDLVKKNLVDQVEVETEGASVTNLTLYDVYRVNTASSHYQGTPYTFTFENGLLTNVTAGSTIDLFTNSTPSNPTISNS